MYNRFAACYDEIMPLTADYDGVYARYISLIRQYKKSPGNILLDLGCGTGRLTALFESDFDVIGADNSADCLSVAATRVSNNVRLIKQDMRKLDLFGTVDITVSAFDVLNHLATLADIKAAASRVKLFTNPGGVFLFDYNTPYKHEKVLADRIFTYDTEHFFCAWENFYKGGAANAVRMNITCFEKGSDGRYERFDESFSETAFELSAVEKILTATGFRVSVVGFNENEPPCETSEKVIFVCEA
jgi:ubiquinone/menaquinone biosynthesis C-methylase UbiE